VNRAQFRAMTSIGMRRCPLIARFIEDFTMLPASN
jgi:hypothetical protein